MKWASMFSVVSAVAYLVRRNLTRRNPGNMTSPFQAHEPSWKPNIATIVESAEELAPNIKAYKGK